MHLAERDSNFLVFKVKQNAGSTEKVVCLRGQLRGNVYFLTSGGLKEELEIKIAQKDFPQQGIAEFKLLDSNLSPLAERLVYINMQGYAVLVITGKFLFNFHGAIPSVAVVAPPVMAQQYLVRVVIVLVFKFLDIIPSI